MILALCISLFAASSLCNDAVAVRRELAVGMLPSGSKDSSFTAVFDEVATADRAADAAWRRISTRAEYVAHRKMLWLKMVEAIGGLPEKLMAAMRSGIKTALIPADNEQDLVDVADEVKENLTIIPVKTVQEVLERTGIQK